MNLPATARAAVMTAARADLELRDFPMPPAPIGGALVRVRCCTICRSDLHTWQGRRSGPTPAILGHEIIGEVVQLSAGLTRDARDRPLSRGDRVTWTLHSCCGTCRYCTEFGLPMKCRSLRKYGHDSCDEAPRLRGGFAEYCVIDAGTRLLRLPPDLPDAVAAPANCAAATVVAGLEAAELRSGATILIQGAGALGCYAAAFAAHAGCRRIIVTDVSPERLEFIRRFGATDCLDVAQATVDQQVAFVHRATDGFGADCALELAGVPSAVEAGLKCLRKGGRYIEIGCSFPEAYAKLDLSLVLWNLLTLRGVHNYDVRHLATALDALSATRETFPYRELVGASYGLDEINRALAAAEAGAALRIAVIP